MLQQESQTDYICDDKPCVTSSGRVLSPNYHPTLISGSNRSDFKVILPKSHSEEGLLPSQVSLDHEILERVPGSTSPSSSDGCRDAASKTMECDDQLPHTGSSRDMPADYGPVSPSYQPQTGSGSTQQQHQEMVMSMNLSSGATGIGNWSVVSKSMQEFTQPTLSHSIAMPHSKPRHRLSPQLTEHSGKTENLTNSSLGTPHHRLSPLSAEQSSSKPARSYQSEPDFLAVKSASDCLHAQDYIRMIVVLSRERPSIAVHFGRGLAYYKLKKHQEAIQNFTSMDQLTSMDLSENANVYLAHYYLAEIDFSCNRYRNAAKHYHKASRAYSTETVAKRYRIVQPTLAIIHSKQGSALRHAQLIMEAVKAYKAALNVAESKKDQLTAYTSLGNLYQSLGENSTALIQYEHTIVLAEELHDYVSLGWAYGNMGNAYLGQYQKDKALRHLEKSLELTIEHEPTPQAIGRAYNNLGTAYQSLNELEKAHEYYDLALSQAIYGSDMGGQARVYGNFGNLLMIQKKLEPAIVHYSEALAISTDRSTRSTAHHNRGCAYYEKAENDKKKFLKIEKPVKDDDFPITYTGPGMNGQPRDPSLTDSVKKGYENGRDDLSKVVEFHEETFQTMKGSSHGLSLSVSLFETNSRSFHRLQDCLFNLGQWENAMEFAEQSRARTLGELLLQRKSGQLRRELTSPLKFEQIKNIIESIDTIVVYISFTGARLLTWVFVPTREGKIVKAMFQVSLEDDQFEGKSLDYFLRYLLADQLIENTVEMYSYCTYDESQPLSKLYKLFGEPLLKILNEFSDNRVSTKDIILIPDSYTNLIPVVALLNATSKKFLGDKFYFRIMPSLLTLGILSQFSEVRVRVPEESQNFCVVGNPTIPSFKYQEETWNLGKLPFATQEAEAVAHIIKCNPTLHEQATKAVVLSMISAAKVVHLATHGSAASGFLAFAGLGSSRSRTVSDEKLILLYPEDIEKLSINPALVVLSSCDSGRGNVKADGIQGMARAFILAGAQSVLTTLWRVPDESAAIFMQFFYQYMMDGFKSSHALHKAMLSMRSFKKYSRYIHWSGYQLTGRDVQFCISETASIERIRTRMGPSPVFPRLDVVKSLEKSFVKDPYLPADVQVIVGIPGLEPLEPVIEFVSNNHQHFTGGIFFINTQNEHLMKATEEAIKEELIGTPSSREQPTLFIFDNLLQLPSDSSYFYHCLCQSNAHIILLLDVDINRFPLDSLKRDIECKLLRGCNVTNLEPLQTVQSTQRIVHGIVGRSEFAPYNREQEILADIAERTCGSPDLVGVVSSLLSKYIDSEEEGLSDSEGFLERFYKDVCSHADYLKEDETNTSSTKYDFAARMISTFNLSKTDHFLLATLSLFGNVPIPRGLIERIELMAIMASSEPPRQCRPMTSLISANLLHICPSPVIQSPSKHDTHLTHISTSIASKSARISSTEPRFYYVTKLISKTVRLSMNKKDKIFSLTAAHRSLSQFCEGYSEESRSNFLMAGYAKIIHDVLQTVIDPEQVEELNCYKEAYRTYLKLQLM